MLGYILNKIKFCCYDKKDKAIKLEYELFVDVSNVSEIYKEKNDEDSDDGPLESEMRTVLVEYKILKIIPNTTHILSFYFFIYLTNISKKPENLVCLYAVWKTKW